MIALDGLRLSVSWLTVLPWHARSVDRNTCRAAIGFAPFVGALVGAVGALLLWALTALGASGLLAGLLVVAAFALLTRGMHVDGLADAVDGLGCYGPPERALGVMRDGSTGPFAVTALVLVLGVQATSLAELAHSPLTVVLACATGRAGFALCCRAGMPAARPDGMGALVAGTQPAWRVAAWWVLLAVAGLFVVGWYGLGAVLVAGLVLLLLSRHVQRRFGGITGDVLGAASEFTTTVVLAGCALA